MRALVFLGVGGLAAAAAAAYYALAKKRRPPPMPTAEEVALVDTTWAAVRGGDGGLAPVGILFFSILFEQQPESFALFKKFNRIPDYKQSPEFLAHASAVINTVDTAFSLLHDLPTLVPVLQALGKAHVKYGIKPVHYDYIGAALLATLAAGLGGAFTPETEQAYATVWGVVAATMIGDNYN